MRQAPVLIALGLFVQIAAADAQTAQYGDRTAIVVPQMPARINVGMNMSQRVSTSFDEQRRVDQVLRRRLYEMATDECKLLVDVLGGDCRIVQLNVNSNIQNNNETPMINSNINAQYEMVPRR